MNKKSLVMLVIIFIVSVCSDTDSYAKEMYASTNVNVRKGPGVNFEVSNVLSKGETVDIDESFDHSSFYKINGSDLYVSKKFLQTEKPDTREYIGSVKLTSYCACTKCSGKWGDLSRLGTKLVDGDCAVDPKVIPLGSYVLISGKGVYHAVDTGSGVKGLHIDIYDIHGHQHALQQNDIHNSRYECYILHDYNK